MGESLVRTRTEGAFYFVTLDRAAKRNALTTEFMREIADAVSAADDQPGLRAVIVEAAGPVFSAGIDVMSLAGKRAEAGEQNPARWLRRMAEDMQHQLHRIEQTELPVIGVLEGGVYGLGLELALAFDFRIAGEDCVFCLPETRLGLIADVGGTTRLHKLVGPSRTKDMLMTTRNVDTAEALSWGLINRVAPRGGALAVAIALAQEIAKNAPLAVGLAKYVIDQGEGADRYTQMAIERLAQSQLISSEDLGEALGAFLEKRPPEFKGA